MSDGPYTGDTQYTRLPHAEIPGCALVQDLIPLYLDNEVTPDSHVLIAEHLQRCERCSGYLKGARSVRDQMLREQQTIRQTTTSSARVAQIQQPIASSLGIVLWQMLMTLLYFGGLFLGLLGFGGHQPGAVAVGGALTVAALCGLIVAGAVKTSGWWIMMVVTGLGGLGLVVISTLFGVGSGLDIVIYGTGMIGLAGCGMVLHRSQQPATQSTPLSAARPIAAAIIGIISAMVCAGLIAFGGIIAIESFRVEQLLIGFTMIAVGVTGLLLINQRMGWIANPLSSQTMQRAAGLALIAAGGIAMLMLLDRINAGVGPVSLGVVAVLAGCVLLLRRSDGTARS